MKSLKGNEQENNHHHPACQRSFGYMSTRDHNERAIGGYDVDSDVTSFCGEKFIRPDSINRRATEK